MPQNRLTFKTLVPSDLITTIVEKAQYNFDQILINGGGPMGPQGPAGEKGLPGRTGIGEKGEKGDKGSEIFFVQQQINLSTPVDPSHNVGDVVIDSQGDYYKVEEIGGQKKYIFKFNINTSSLINPYWIDEDKYSTPPVATNNLVNTHILKQFNDPLNKSRNLVVADRSDNGGGYDKSEYYRVMIGLDAYPAPNTINSTLFLANIPHNLTDPSNNQFFSQLALKFRSDASSYVSANSTFFIYREENQVNLFKILNGNTALGIYEDTLTSDTSFYVKSKYIHFIGQSTDINNITEYVTIKVEQNVMTMFIQKDVNIVSDNQGDININGFINGSFEFDTITLTPTTGSNILITSASEKEYHSDVKLTTSSQILKHKSDVIEHDNYSGNEQLHTGIKQSYDNVSRFNGLIQYKTSQKIVSNNTLILDTNSSVIHVTEDQATTMSLDIIDNQLPLSQSDGGTLLFIIFDSNMEVRDSSVSSGNIKLRGGVTTKFFKVGDILVLYKDEVYQQEYRELHVIDNISGLKVISWASNSQDYIIDPDVTNNITFDNAPNSVLGTHNIVLSNMAKKGDSLDIYFKSFPSSFTGDINVVNGVNGGVIKTFTDFEENMYKNSITHMRAWYDGSTWVLNMYNNYISGGDGKPTGIFFSNTSKINANNLNGTSSNVLSGGGGSSSSGGGGL